MFEVENLRFDGCWVATGKVLELYILAFLFELVGDSFLISFVCEINRSFSIHAGEYVVLELDCTISPSLPYGVDAAL